MRILLLPALLPLLVACASSNPAGKTPSSRQATTRAVPPPTVTTTRTATPERRVTSDPGTRWMPVQPVGALTAETEPRPPTGTGRPAGTVSQPAPRSAIMPGTPPDTPSEWTTPPTGAAPLGDPPAGTGLPRR